MVKDYGDDPRVLLCDYARPHYPPRIPHLRAHANRLGLRVRACRYDRTRKGWHLVIWTDDPLSKMERIALQAIFGSDRQREGLNFLRARSLNAFPSAFWERRWNLLFSRKLTAA